MKKVAYFAQLDKKKQNAIIITLVQWYRDGLEMSTEEQCYALRELRDSKMCDVNDKLRLARLDGYAWMDALY